MVKNNAIIKRSVISKWRANERFSYGYLRAEVMAGFLNGVFLVFIAFFILSEAIEVTFCVCT